MDIGRNDPCPCGSGKKYKKCCLNNQSETKLASKPVENRSPLAELDDEEDELVVAGDVSDYGTPLLRDKLFAALSPKGISAYDLIEGMARNPEIGLQVEKITRNLIFRGKEEARRIKKTKSAEELVRIMLENPDPINHRLLIETGGPGDLSLQKN